MRSWRAATNRSLDWKTDMNNRTTTFAIAILIAGLSFAESRAQDYWGNDVASSCSERGGCHREYHGYHENDGYGYSDFYRSRRLPYDDGQGYGDFDYRANEYQQTSGCNHGGTCSRGNLISSGRFGITNPLSSCRDGHCGYEESQHGHAHGSGESPYRNQDSIGDSYGQQFAVPSRRNNSYQPYPADRRPQLNAPSAASGYDYARNERSGFDLQREVPQTPSQIIPPPKLPPQPNSNRFDSVRGNQSTFRDYSTAPQQLPPTSFSQKTRENSSVTDDHAGHSHAEHDHAGHDHNH